MTNIANWVEEETATTGTGPVTLGTNPVAGFATFQASFGSGTLDVYYSLESGDNRETGIGSFNGTTNVLTRTTVMSTLVSGVYDDASPTAITLSGTSVVRCTFNAAAFESFGDVLGPAGGTVDDEFALFDDTTGERIRGASGTTLTSMVAAINGKVDGAGLVSNRAVTVFDGTSGASIDEAGYTQTQVITQNQTDQYLATGNKASPVSADRLLIEDSAASYGKKYVDVGDLPTGVVDLTDAEFPTYAVFDAKVVNSSVTVDFSNGNKQEIDAATYSAITVQSPTGHPANFVLRLLNSASLTSLASATEGGIQWNEGTAPTWSGKATVFLYYDGSEWEGSANVGLAT